MKMPITCTVWLVLLSCNCPGLGKKVGHPHRGRTTPSNANQRPTAQPSAPPYEETKKIPVDPTAPPPAYEEATGLPSYEKAIQTTAPPAYEKATA